MEAFESNQGIAHAELSHYVRGFVKALAPPSTLRIDEWMQQTWKKGLGVSAYDEGGDDDKGPTRRCVETLLGVSFPEKVTSPSTNNQIQLPSDVADAGAPVSGGLAERPCRNAIYISYLFYHGEDVGARATSNVYQRTGSQSAHVYVYAASAARVWPRKLV